VSLWKLHKGPRGYSCVASFSFSFVFFLGGGGVGGGGGASLRLTKTIYWWYGDDFFNIFLRYLQINTVYFVFFV